MLGMIKTFPLRNLNLSRRKLQSADILVIVAQRPLLEQLNLSATQIKDTDIHFLTHLTALTQLSLESNNIGALGAQAIALLSNLTYLDLRKNNIQDSGTHTLTQLTALTHLNLEENNIGALGAQAIALLPKLTYLDLKKNNIQDADTHALTQLTALTHLNLEENNIGPNGVYAFTRLTTLTDLNLSANDIGPTGARALMHFTALTRLNLAGNNIVGHGLEPLFLPSRLATLDLTGTEIGPDDANALTQLTALTDLNLSGNAAIGDHCALILRHLSSLTSLNLKLTGISNTTVQTLVLLTDLTHLDLTANDINTVGIQALTQLTNLSHLSFGGLEDDIGPAGARHLSQLPNLTFLKLLNCNIGNAGVDAFLTHTRLLILAIEHEQSIDKEIMNALYCRLADNRKNLEHACKQLLEIFILLARARRQQDGNYWKLLPLELTVRIIELICGTKTLQFLRITPKIMMATYRNIVKYCADHPPTGLSYPYSRVPQFLRSLPSTLWTLTREETPEAMREDVLDKNIYLLKTSLQLSDSCKLPPITPEKNPKGKQTLALTQSGLFKTTQNSIIKSPFFSEISGLIQITYRLINDHHKYLQTPSVTPKHCHTFLHCCDVIRLQVATVLEKAQSLKIQERHHTQLKIIHDKLGMFSTALKETDENKHLDQSEISSTASRPGKGL
jgi:Leucine-rich repeat (LRR) protein